ncbi:MAG: hypothetical protein HY348_16205 [Nitrospira defluvii]|nr:hypothetical protein [Nitrospira defluvii]
MPDPAGEKHQLAGFDAQERGFNRPVEFLRSASGFQATLRYEATRIVTPEALSPAEALQQLILLLQQRGYTQLRSQQSYRDGIYLGSQELWVEYPDRPAVPEVGIFALLKKWFGRSPG